ncbi:hypothetical protein F5887DRAFT_371643 [Amanita rubescens]|nr:hypothetical protein F5887DRAFT_371643 [Amanita rubescens]
MVTLILLILLSAVASAPSPNTTWPHLSATLSHLRATTGSLVTLAPYHNSSSLYDAIQAAPCVLLYTFASWSAHAHHLILRRNLIQQIARDYSRDIQSHSLAIVAMEIFEPPVDDASWDFIVNDAYWGSMGMFYNHSPRGMFAVGDHNSENMALAIDRCLASVIRPDERSRWGNASFQCNSQQGRCERYVGL